MTYQELQNELVAASMNMQRLTDEQTELMHKLRRNMIAQQNQVSVTAELYKRYYKQANVDNVTYWHPVTEVPDENKDYIVKARNGRVFISSPVNGKWISNIELWTNCPE